MAANALLSSGSSGGIRLTQMKSGTAVPSARSARSRARSTVSGQRSVLSPSSPSPGRVGTAALLLHQLPVNPAARGAAASRANTAKSGKNQPGRMGRNGFPLCSSSRASSPTAWPSTAVPSPGGVTALGMWHLGTGSVWPWLCWGGSVTLVTITAVWGLWRES